MEMFLVGGAVRDRIMGRPCKDWDFTVVLSDEQVTHTGRFRITPFDVMQSVLAERGFEILNITPDKFTVRARAPKGWTFMGEPAPRVCDFVLARKETQVGDGRGDIVVQAGTLADDLARRDFTMNAIAMDSDGTVIDPHNGSGDIRNGVIRTVGMPKARFRQDWLRVLRAIRFAVVLGFTFDPLLELELNMRGFWWVTGPDVVQDRIREELRTAFRADTVRTLALLARFGMLDLFAGNMWLEPTVQAR